MDAIGSTSGAGADAGMAWIFRGPRFSGGPFGMPLQGSDAAGQPSREVAQLAQGLQLNLTHTLP